jgi:hypothetical protein
MDPLLTALHILFLFRLISGSNNYEEEQPLVHLSEVRTLGEFKAIVQAAAEGDDKNFLESLPDMLTMTPEEYACYSAMRYRAVWCTDPGFVPNIDWEKYISSISCADNPAVLELLSAEQQKAVLDPTKLATYDSILLAKTLPDPRVFSENSVDLIRLGSVQIATFLLEGGYGYSFPLFYVFKTENIQALQLFIENGLWKPEMDDFGYAIVLGAYSILPSLLQTMNVLPPEGLVSQLVQFGVINALQSIHSLNVGWRLSEDNANIACRMGHLHILEWWISVDPNMPRPNSRALMDAHVSNHMNIINWIVERYHGGCRNSCQPEWIASQEAVDYACNVGRLDILKWWRSANPNMPQPSSNALKKACDDGHLETRMGCGKVLRRLQGLVPAWLADKSTRCQ